MVSTDVTRTCPIQTSGPNCPWRSPASGRNEPVAKRAPPQQLHSHVLQSLDPVLQEKTLGHQATARTG
eukprot:8577014-Pyramimonas_sp.AAC.1